MDKKSIDYRVTCFMKSLNKYDFEDYSIIKKCKCSKTDDTSYGYSAAILTILINEKIKEINLCSDDDELYEKKIELLQLVHYKVHCIQYLFSTNTSWAVQVHRILCNYTLPFDF